MKYNYLKYGIGSIIFLLMIFAAFMLIRPVYLEINNRLQDLKDYAFSYIEDKTGFSIDYESLSPSILSGIRISGIEVKELDNDSVVGKIDSVVINYRLIKLFEKDFLGAIRSVSVNGFELGWNEHLTKMVMGIVESVKQPQEEQPDAQNQSGNEEENDVTAILAGISKFNLPFPIIFRQAKLRYSAGKTALDLQLDGIKATEGDGKNTSFSVDFSGRFSVSAPIPEISVEVLKGVFPDVMTLTTSFSAQIVVTPELEGTFAKLKLSNSNGNSFSVSGCDFSANMNGDRISCSLFSYGNPFAVTLTHNFSSKKTSVYFNAEDFSPFSFITIKNSNDFLKKLDYVKLSGVYGVDLFDNGESLTYNMSGGLDIPLGLLPESLFPDGAYIVADLEGSLQSVKINTLHLVSEKMDVSYFGSLDIVALQPEGELYIETFQLPSGQNAQGEFFAEPYGEGFSLFAPQVYLGSTGLTAVQATCIPGSVSTDFSFSVSDYSSGEQPGTIYADGSLLMENNMFLQAGVSVNNLSFSSVMNLINSVLPAESSLPASLVETVSPYTASFNLYGTSDFESFTYNLSNAVIVNSTKEGERLSLSLDGNETTVQITDLELSYAGQELTASLSADANEDYSEIFFSSDFRVNTLPYSLSGVFQRDESLSITGDYGFDVNLEFGRDGMLSGSVAASSLPLMIFDYIASFDVESDFVFFSKDDWHINVSHFAAVENTGKFKLEPGIEFQCYADMYGVMLDNVAYGDNVSALTGNGSIAWDFSGGNLSSASLMLNMSNPDTSEALIIDLSGSNPLQMAFSDEGFMENFMISGTTDIVSFPSAKLLAQQDADNTITASISALGPLGDPFISVEIPSASLKFGGSSMEVAGAFEMEEKVVTCNYLEGFWQKFSLGETTGSFSIEDMAGTIRSNLKADLGSFLNASSPIELNVKIGKKEEDNQLDASILFEKLETNLIDPIENYKISVSRKKGKMEFTAGQKGLIYGSFSDEGELYAKVDGDFPITFTAGGNIKEKEMDILLTSIKGDILTFKRFIPEELIRVESGLLSGRLHIGGPFVDPEFSGSVKLENISVALDNFLKNPITVDSLTINADQNMFILNDGRIHCGNAEARVDVNVEMEQWGLASLLLNFKTLGGKTIAGDIKLPFASIIAGIGGNLSVELTPEDISVTGSVSTENAIFSLTDVTALGNDSEEDEEPKKKMNVIVDLDFLLGPKTEIYYPDKNNPMVRGLVSAQAPIHIGLDTYSETFSLNGGLSLKGGEISFLGRSFYLREGRIDLKENESDFNPEISFRAELRERDADGTPIKIILSADKQKLKNLNPRLTSEPNRSEDELRKLLGAALFSVGDIGSETFTATELLGQVAAGGIDFLIQNSLFRQLENRLREFFHFDIFSFRTPFFQQALLQVFKNDAGNTNPSNFLDNTTVYIGKYIGTDLYLDAMFRLVYATGSSLDGSKGRLVLQPEIGLELPSPFATIRWSIAPDITSAQNLWVPNTSISLSWKFSF